MATKLEAATTAAEQSGAEVSGLRQELEEARKELATTASAREEVAARVVELEDVVERSADDALRLETELAAVKEQLKQTAGAAVQAERARQAAGSEVEALRSEVVRARAELTAANTEIERVKAANTGLEKQIASFHTSSRSAIQTARENLLMMEEKIAELNAVLGVGEPEEAAATPRR
jgi:chromosome segregation ATPase